MKEVLGALLSMPETHDGVRAFAKRWGLLSPATDVAVDEFYEARRELLRAQIIGKDSGFKGLARALRPSEGNVRGDPDAPRLGIADIQVVRPPRGHPEIHWYVQSLHVFLWLELCLDLDGPAALVQCENPKCRKWHAQKSKGPAPAYCSNACRQAVWRAAHRAKINKARRQKRRQLRRAHSCAEALRRLA